MSNNGDDTVSVIDLNTLHIVALIPVGCEPRGSAITPDGRFVYVPNRFDDTVSVIDTETNTVIETIDVGSEPYNAVCTPNGAFVYVVNRSSTDVSVISTATQTEDLIIDLDITASETHGIDVTPDGSKVYVANRNSDTVEVISTATNTLVGSPIAVGVRPRDLKVSTAGDKVMVVGDGVPTIIDTATNTASATVFEDLGSHRDVGVAGNFAYASNDRNVNSLNFRGSLDIYDLSNETFVESIMIGGRFDEPNAVVVSGDGKTAWVCLEEGEHVQAVDLVLRQETGDPIDVGDLPRGITAFFASEGNEAPPDTIDSFLLPKKIRVKTGAKPSVKVVGFFDTGSQERDLSLPATLTIGPVEIQIPQLESVRNGKFFVFDNDEVSLKITPSPFGTSKGKFKLVFTGDLGAFDLNGDFILKYFGGGGIQAEGSVVLQNGTFRFGRAGGTLKTPAIDIRKAKAKLTTGRGKHTFKFVAGLAGDGMVPAQAPDVNIAFGDIFNVTLPSDIFRLQGSTFVLNGPGPKGVQEVAFNLAKERIAVRGGQADLGDVAIGPVPLLLIVTLDQVDVRAVLVRAFFDGKNLKY